MPVGLPRHQLNSENGVSSRETRRLELWEVYGDSDSQVKCEQNAPDALPSTFTFAFAFFPPETRGDPGK
jgi:hypothetical protein